MKLAIIGFGSMGRKHYDALLRLGVGVDYVLDTKPIDLSNTRTFTYLDDLLEENVTAAIISSPLQTHKEIASDCLNRGINLLIEKPATGFAHDIDELIASLNNNRVAVAYIERFNPAIDCLLKELRGNRIINMTMVRESPLRSVDSCILRELSVHDVDLASFITGERGLDSTHIFSSSVDVKIDINFGSIPVSIFTRSSTDMRKRILSVYTEDSHYKVNLLSKTVDKYNEAGGKVSLLVEAKDNLEEELKSFISWQLLGISRDNRLASLGDARHTLSLLGFCV